MHLFLIITTGPTWNTNMCSNDTGK